MDQYASTTAALGTEFTQRMQQQQFVISGNNLMAEYLTLQLVGLGAQKISYLANSDEPPSQSFIHRIMKTKKKITSLDEFFFTNFSYVQADVLDSYLEPVLAEKQIVFFETSRSDKIIKHNRQLLQAHTFCYECGSTAYLMGNVSQTTSLTPMPEYAPVCGITASLLANTVLEANKTKLTPPASFWLSTPDCKAGFPKYDVQKRNAKHTLIVGLGGIGTYVALAHAQIEATAATLADFDTIELTNINRQLLYSPAHVGQYKADIMKLRLQAINKNTQYNTVKDPITSANVDQITRDVDMIFVCTDNAESRILLSEIAERKKIPLVEGACSVNSAIISQYLPDITEPIHKQRRFKQSEQPAPTPQSSQQNPESCRLANPSVVMPNCVAGNLMAYAGQIRIDKATGKLAPISRPMHYNPTQKWPIFVQQ